MRLALRGWPRESAAARIDRARDARPRTMPGAATARRPKNEGRPTMPLVTWDHVHLRSPDPEATAAWLENILGGVIIRGPGRIDVKLGGANVFIAPVTAGGRGHNPPLTPPQGPDQFRLAGENISTAGAATQRQGGEVPRRGSPHKP